jgi:hypothetical protein
MQKNSRAVRVVSAATFSAGNLIHSATVFKT